MVVKRQTPPQAAVPDGQTQVPLPLQYFPPVQAFPQPPQLLPSTRVSTQVPLQLVRVPAQTQTPPVQTRSAAQEVVQLPQKARSVWVLTQEVPHFEGVEPPQVRPQELELQTSPEAQTVEQFPQ